MSKVTIEVKHGEGTRKVRVNCIARKKGYALHRAVQPVGDFVPDKERGFTVTDIKSGKAFVYGLAREAAERVLNRIAREHPNCPSAEALAKRLTWSAKFVEWYRWHRFWQYGGYKPRPLPKRRLLALRRKKATTPQKPAP